MRKWEKRIKKENPELYKRVLETEKYLTGLIAGTPENLNYEERKAHNRRIIFTLADMCLNEFLEDKEDKEKNYPHPNKERLKELAIKNHDRRLKEAESGEVSNEFSFYAPDAYNEFLNAAEGIDFGQHYSGEEMLKIANGLALYRYETQLYEDEQQVVNNWKKEKNSRPFARIMAKFLILLEDAGIERFNIHGGRKKGIHFLAKKHFPGCSVHRVEQQINKIVGKQINLQASDYDTLIELLEKYPNAKKLAINEKEKSISM